MVSIENFENRGDSKFSKKNLDAISSGNVKQSRFSIEKNILDLDYNTYLNWFNILALFIGTSYVAVVVGTLSSEKIEWTIFKVLSTAIFIFY